MVGALVPRIAQYICAARSIDSTANARQYCASLCANVLLGAVVHHILSVPRIAQAESTPESFSVTNAPNSSKHDTGSTKAQISTDIA
eukprot:2177555-Rhodomonas_salina.2